MTKIVAIGMLSLLGLALACGSTTTGPTAECSVNADCGTGKACAFASADGCGAKGKCVERAGESCLAFIAGCACDGTEITTECTGLPQGYVSKPLRDKGACAGPGGSKKPCTSHSDCTPDEACAFEASEGCDAKGKCIGKGGPACAMFVEGCACDGTAITTECTGLWGGVSKPLRHKGPCDGKDAGGDATTD